MDNNVCFVDMIVLLLDMIVCSVDKKVYNYIHQNALQTVNNNLNKYFNNNFNKPLL
jgi:hypothetical protein